MDEKLEIIHSNRRFMHCPSFAGPMSESDQSKGIAPPPFGKAASGSKIILPAFDKAIVCKDYTELLGTRRSKRKYEDSPMSQEQLAFMLWSTQGMQSFRGETAVFRTVPSGGARHPFEVYIAVKSVDGLDSGLYHYLPTENIGEKIVTIEKLGEIPNYEESITQMLAGQSWAAKAPIVLFYTCIPYRAEWRYREMAHRVVLIDLGHVGQNAMLSAVALGLGSCCMAAFDQKSCDELLKLDGLEEYTVYAVSVG